MLKYYLMVVMLGGLLTPLATQASSIGVQFLIGQNQAQALNTPPGNFGPNTNVNIKAGYAPVAQTNWNSIAGVAAYTSTLSPGTSAMCSNLIDNTGAPTTVWFSGTGYFYSGDKGNSFNASDPNQIGDNMLAWNDFMSQAGNIALYNLYGIPYTNYTVYVYLAMNASSAGPGWVTNVTTGAYQTFTPTTVGASGNTSGWFAPATPGGVGTLLIFTNLSGNSQEFKLYVPANGGANGIQIVDSDTGKSIAIQFWENVDFTHQATLLHTPNPVNVKAGVASVAQTNWNSVLTGVQNQVINGMVFSNLIDSTGANVNPFFAAVSGTSWNQASYFDSSDPNQVGDTYLGGGGLLAKGATHAYVGITNVPYAQYDLYVYLAVNNPGNSGQCTVGSTVNTYTTTSINSAYVSTSQWQTITNQGDIADYLVFTNLTGSSQLVDLYIPSNGSINGFQIVQTGIVAPIPLNVSYAGGNVTLTWSDSSFSLQSAANVGGPYTTIVGATSGYTEPVGGTKKFYRLIH